MIFIIIGVVIVFGSVLGGFLMEHGHPLVLAQPAELLIIIGSSVGTILVANPRRNLANLFAALSTLVHPLSVSRRFYLEVLKLLFVMFSFARRHGIAALEKHVETPQSSEIFNDNTVLAAHAEVLAYLCDSIRIVTAAGLSAEELERLFAVDLEVQRAGRNQPVAALMHLADSLPGLGIVAAVLGVVVTMQALGGPASEIGHKVAAALVGTFLGILLCYGLVAPLATHLQQLNRTRQELLHVIRAGTLAFVRGCSPLVAIEFSRRSVPADLRPSLDDMEEELRHNTRVPQNGAETAVAPAAAPAPTPAPAQVS
jgi:chemotaxis protein MotA